MQIDKSIIQQTHSHYIANRSWWNGVKFGFLMLLVFISGFIVNANLGNLVDTNPSYEAAWWKIVFAMLNAVMFSAFAWRASRAI